MEGATFFFLLLLFCWVFFFVETEKESQKDSARPVLWGPEEEARLGNLWKMFI